MSTELLVTLYLIVAACWLILAGIFHGRIADLRRELDLQKKTYLMQTNTTQEMLSAALRHLDTLTDILGHVQDRVNENRGKVEEIEAFDKSLEEADILGKLLKLEELEEALDRHLDEQKPVFDFDPDEKEISI